MAKGLDKIKRYLKGQTATRLAIIICAAVLLELIGIIQYYSMRNIQREAVERRVRTELGFKSLIIANNLDKAEATLQEHLWDIQTHLKDPDAMFDVTGRLIAANKQIVGGCIAFVPNYYPQKGVLFEPYASKENGIITVKQLAVEDHDYNKHPAFIKAVNERKELWSDPYEYDGDTLTTFTYPLIDENDRVVAACGLDLDLSWLSDTLNTYHVFPSSFGMMFTQEGKIVVRPSEGKATEKDLKGLVGLVLDSLAARKTLPTERSRSVNFNNYCNGRNGCIFFTTLRKEPHWIVATVNYYDEIYEPVKRMRLLNTLMMLTGLLILFFIINRFARSERKLQEAGIKQARIGRELQIANGIQEAMLPKKFPPFPERQDVDVYGSLTPAKEVGGDLFDFFIRDEKLFFCIGDVSGKGVPSAIVMAMVQKLFRMATSHETNPAFIVEEMNEELSRANTTNMFITFFLGILDLPTGRLRYCNAGHDNPIIVQIGEEQGTKLLPVKANLPIGVFGDFKYENEEYVLPEKAFLFLYTDGLTEAKNAQHELFKMQRIEQVLNHSNDNPSITAKELLSMMTEEVNRFVGDAEQSDDLTMMAICYKQIAVNDSIQQSITLKNDVRQVTQLNDFVKQFTVATGVDKKVMRQLQLAIEEVVVNVMSYAYPLETEGDILVEAAFNGQRIKFTISDEGAAFDPTIAKNADTSLSAEERPIGGLGILLTRKLVDTINYERINGRNILTLKKMV